MAKMLLCFILFALSTSAGAKAGKEKQAAKNSPSKVRKRGAPRPAVVPYELVCTEEVYLPLTPFCYYGARLLVAVGLVGFG